MKKSVLVAAMLMMLSTGVWAESTASPVPAPPGKPTTVGGGIPNPWRNPYRTAVVVQVVRE